MCGLEVESMEKKKRTGAVRDMFSILTIKLILKLSL